MKEIEQIGRLRLIRRLNAIASLSDHDTHLLMHVPMRVEQVAADEDIVNEGDRQRYCCVVLDGFVCRYRLLRAGRRQILSFNVPGDMPDLQSLHLERMDHSLATIVDCTLGFIAHSKVCELIEANPGLHTALWRDSLVDAAMFREWMIGIGQRTALQRIAHLFCEIAVRLEAVGLADQHRYLFPATLNEIADATGLSSVHVSRTMTRLSRAKLLKRRRNGFEVFDWRRLAEAGDFDGQYLHLFRRVQMQDREFVAKGGSAPPHPKRRGE